MNRAAILAVIDDELRKPIAGSGSMRPLHEVTQSVRDRISQHHEPNQPAQHVNVESGSVIPIGLVSEFADRSLSHELSQQVCDAAKRDLSVLMEIVAARRDKMTSSESLSPISIGLQQRLKQMSSDALPTPLATPPVTLPIQSKNPTRRVGVIAAVLATAAILSGIVFLLSRGTDSGPGQQQVVKDDRVPSDPPNLIESPDRGTQDSSPEKLATGPIAPPKSVIDDPAKDILTEPDSSNQNQKPRDAMADTRVPPSESIAMPIKPSSDTNDDPVQPKTVDAISNFRWTRITGLLAARIVQPQRDPSYQSPWLAVDEDSPSDSEQHFRVPVDLITLPSSRAEASIGDSSIGPHRSSFVIASDSHCRLSTPDSSATPNVTRIELLHGAIAMRRMAADSELEIVGIGQQRLFVKSLSGASMVFQYGESGLEAHLDQGVVLINGQRRSNESVAWTADGKMTSIPQPARLPVWTDRPVESIRLPPAVLAQLRSSDNLLSDFSQTIGGRGALGTLNANYVSMLAHWQAAMNDQQLLRLASGTLPQQRQAALQRLFGLPAWDPRYAPVWKAAGRRIRNDRQLQWLQTLGQMAQAGTQPNAGQTDRLFAGLTSADVTIRSISDFLLRTFARGGPPYDPAWTGTAQTRAVALWRKYLGR